MAGMFFTAFITVMGAAISALFAIAGFMGLLSSKSTASDRGQGFWMLGISLSFAIFTRWVVK
jgi:hypothetical protein